MKRTRMRPKYVNILSNVSYTIVSNVVMLIVSALGVLIVPKILSVEGYGYWQLYLFYLAYVGFAHLGLIDGIYLKYGGYDYVDLDKKLFSTQFYLLFIVQLIFVGLMSLYSYNFIEDFDRRFIIYMISCAMVITNLTFMLLLILQATNRIKEYAKITIVGKLVFLLSLVITIVFFRNETFHLLVFLDFISKIVMFVYASYVCREIVISKIVYNNTLFREVISNIKVGTILMFSNIASLMIIGVVRFGVERNWDVTSFAKVSLTLSLSNFLMVFINAMSIVVFPILRKTDFGQMKIFYTVMRDFLMVALLVFLTIYYPVSYFLSIWLPNYIDSIKYMSFLLPICIYEGKMALLTNTYLKTLRKENVMFKINMTSLIFSFILTVISTVILRNLTLTVLSIIVIFAFRSILAEIVLSYILNVKVFKDLFLESILVITFISSTWFLSSGESLCLYSISLVIFLVIKRKSIQNSWEIGKKSVFST